MSSSSTAQQLQNNEELGDQKPIQLLRQLLEDQEGATESTFLQELFLQRLPLDVHMVLPLEPQLI